MSWMSLHGGLDRLSRESEAWIVLDPNMLEIPEAWNLP